MKRVLYKLLLVSGGLSWVLLPVWLFWGDTLAREANEGRAELVGGLADRYIASQAAPAPAAGEVKTVAGLHHIPIQRDEVVAGIFRASGVANSYLIATPEGNVLFDGGLATQAAKQKRFLQEAAPGDLKFIILSHSHADHIGATKFWLREYPEAQVITHERFAEGQRYLTDLQPYFWNRNRLLYTFMPEAPAEPGALFAYGGIKADITVGPAGDYAFTLGGRRFNVVAAPGAEGDDNLVLWLPDERVLFSGDVFGPLFPMLPNLFTLRGEKFRDPLAYVATLDKLIGLAPERVLPSHFDPVTGADEIAASLHLMRDATRYVHDATVDGMNAGKSLWQLMDEIRLPESLAVSQGHGKVSWNVRSIWEYYSTWFHFESTTELYAVPVSGVYKALAEMASVDSLTLAAQRALEADEPERALHFLEIAEAAGTQQDSLSRLKIQALEALLARARAETGNFSEVSWLQSRISLARSALSSR